MINILFILNNNIIIIFSLIFTIIIHESTIALNIYDFIDTRDVKEDAKLTTPELIKKYKYPVEIHYVTTEDGYILQIHRIIKKNAEPFLLVHGLIDSSATFVLMGPNQGLGYYLWNKGYDVWMGNCRGNRYSRNHTQLNPDNNQKFWNFSWHEIGMYDLPAMIDYILNETKYDKLHYVGHSQGTTSFFVMSSKRPEYNTKIFLMHALSPAAYCSDIKCPLCFLMEYFLNTKLSYVFNEFLPNYPVADSLFFTNPIMKLACVHLYYLIMGPNPSEYNNTLYSLIHSHMPAGCSIKQFRHYFQLIKSGKFTEYDYDKDINMKIYKNIKPLSYNLSKITTPIILYFGKNDYLSEPNNTHRLYKELSNVIGLYQIDDDNFSHMDFCWGINAKYLVYDRMIKSLEDYKIGKLRYIIE